MYTVFYHKVEEGFFQLKTDYPTIEEAEMFIQSDHFRFNKLKFGFLLKDGSTLIKGMPIEETEQHYKQSMMFALDIPKEEWVY